MKPQNHWSFRTNHEQIDAARIMNEAQAAGGCIVDITIGGQTTTLVRADELRSAYRHSGLDLDVIESTYGLKMFDVSETGKIVPAKWDTPPRASMTDGSWQVWREKHPGEWPHPSIVLAKYREYLASIQRVAVAVW